MGERTIKCRANKLYRAMKMLAVKKGYYPKFVEAYSNNADKFKRKEFDSVMMPILEANYDIYLLPEPTLEKRLWPSNWPGSIPLLCQTTPEEAAWAGK